MLLAAADAQSFSSYGGVGQCEGTWSWSLRFLVMFNGWTVEVLFELNCTLFLFAEGDGVR
jgi:hypothetical protein